jgi:cyanophycin synthetase
LESVAAKNVFVRLRQVPLVNDGGNVVPVFDRIHPDNAALAERAVRLARLDIAGVDFLISDISKSWREVGGHITEINALPQFSPLSRADIYSALLSRLVDADGRVPAALVIGNNNASLFSEIHEMLTEAGLVVGMASCDRIVIGSEELVFAAWRPVQQTFALASDPTVEAIVVFVDGESLLREGLPLDRFDALIIAGDQPAPDNLALILRLAVPHLKGQIIVAQDADLLQISADVVDGQKIETASTLSDLAQRVCSRLAT